jgi:hypothetical protein
MRVAFFALGLIAATGVQAALSDAQAQDRDTRAERSATAAEVPWYERFTFSPGSPGRPAAVATPGGDRTAGWTTNPRSSSVSPSASWGMTFNVGEAERLEGGLAPEAAGKETAVGAYFRFSPRVTVGGRVTVAEPKAVPLAPGPARDEPDAGVKLESAFRF